MDLLDSCDGAVQLHEHVDQLLDVGEVSPIGRRRRHEALGDVGREVVVGNEAARGSRIVARTLIRELEC